jgi:dTDP-4-amino-4,6-dideoxygalactose transaminase
VVPVHLYGQPADMDDIVATARRLGIWVVEDAAQAHGATWRFRRVGSFGVAGCFSFYPGKNLGAFGDAGAVVTDDDRLAAAVRSMRDHGRAANGHHRHDRVGTNSRLDAVQACVLSAKLPRLDGWNAARTALMQAYRGLLRDPVRLVGELPAGRGVHHLAVARVPDRDRVRDELDLAGIRTGLHYPTPCHLMAPYRRYADGPLPATESAAGEIVSLPMYPHLHVDQVERVAAALNSAATGGAQS